METVLKSKSSLVGADAAEVWAHIERYVSEGEAMDAVTKAAADVDRVVGSRRDRVVYGWSGGKDSQALRVVMDRAGIRRAVCGVIPALEFRGYLDWLDRHRFDGLTVIRNRKLTLPWLGRQSSDRYLFPGTARDGYFWALASARYAQYRYQERHAPELQIYGRRTQDGNICGDADGVHRTRRTVAYNPIRHWPHELVMAVVRYAGSPLPPIYDQPDGWKTGTGAWPGRRVGTREESWAKTWKIEPDRVKEAADFVPSARAWLERRP